MEEKATNSNGGVTSAGDCLKPRQDLAGTHAIIATTTFVRTAQNLEFLNGIRFQFCKEKDLCLLIIINLLKLEKIYTFWQVTKTKKVFLVPKFGFFTLYIQNLKKSVK